MIKTNKGKTKMEGTGVILCSDLSVIVKTMYEGFKSDYNEKIAKALLEKAFELGFKTEEELEQETKTKALEVLKLLVSSLESEEEDHE